MRWQLGEAGRDVRGFWIADPDTGTKARFGIVGPEIAAEFVRQGNRRGAIDVMKKPHFGFWFEKRF